jgi:protein gp37
MAKYYDRCYNPILGCNGNFRGCNNCYAKKLLQKRNSQYDFNKVKLNKSQYLKSFDKKPQLIAVCTQSDLFQYEVSNKVIDGVLRKCNNAKYNKYLFLTKFAERMKNYFNADSCLDNLNNNHLIAFSFDNMMMGVTVTCNDDLHRIKDLQNTKLIKHKFIAFEPLLENINLTDDIFDDIEWVIIGAESGENAEYCSVAWIENIVQFANKRNIPIFVNAIHLDNGKITSEFEEMPINLCRNDIPFNINGN